MAITRSCWQDCSPVTWSSRVRLVKKPRQVVRRRDRVRGNGRAVQEEAGPSLSVQGRAVEANSNGHVKEQKPAIEVRALTKDYHLASNVVHALRGVSLR